MTKEKKERKKADIPETETKEERFIRIAKPRLQKIIAQIRMIKQMIGSKAYDISELQIVSIKDQLWAEIEGFADAYNARHTEHGKEDIIVNL